MTRELLLLRHGKSDWKADTDDFLRPLKKRGIRGARKQGEWMKSHSLVPDFILSSPASRAASTANECRQAMGLDSDKIEFDERIYLASIGSLLALLGEIDTKFRRVLLIGHNPGFEQLVEYLSSAVIEVTDGKIMPTATLAHLTMPDDWWQLASHSAVLNTLLRPTP